MKFCICNHDLKSIVICCKNKNLVKANLDENAFIERIMRKRDFSKIPTADMVLKWALATYVQCTLCTVQYGYSTNFLHFLSSKFLFLPKIIDYRYYCHMLIFLKKYRLYIS